MNMPFFPASSDDWNVTIPIRSDERLARFRVRRGRTRLCNCLLCNDKPSSLTVISISSLSPSSLTLMAVDDVPILCCFCIIYKKTNKKKGTIIRKWCYIRYKLFFKEIIIGHENCNVCFQRFKKKKEDELSVRVTSDVWEDEFSLLSGLWCLILMFSVKHRNVLWETIKAFFKYGRGIDAFTGLVWTFWGKYSFAFWWRVGARD